MRRHLQAARHQYPAHRRAAPKHASTDKPSDFSSDITGKVVDSAIGKPVADGTVFVALEELRQGDSDYHLVSVQKADASGNFDFQNVAATGPMLILVTAMNNRDLFDDFYIPYILASAADDIMPGSNVGTLPISYAPGPDASELQVSLNSQDAAGAPTSTTVNFTATTFQLDRHMEFPLPFAPDPVSTQVNGSGCAPGTACGFGKVYLPTSAPTIQYYGGQQIRGNPANYIVNANAVLPGTQVPDCSPSSQQMSVGEVTPGGNTAATVVFNGCQ